MGVDTQLTDSTQRRQESMPSTIDAARASLASSSTALLPETNWTVWQWRNTAGQQAERKCHKCDDVSHLVIKCVFNKCASHFNQGRLFSRRGVKTNNMTARHIKRVKLCIVSLMKDLLSLVWGGITERTKQNLKCFSVQGTYGAHLKTRLSKEVSHNFSFNYPSTSYIAKLHAGTRNWIRCQASVFVSSSELPIMPFWFLFTYKESRWWWWESLSHLRAGSARTDCYTLTKGIKKEFPFMSFKRGGSLDHHHHHHFLGAQLFVDAGAENRKGVEVSYRN